MRVVVIGANGQLGSDVCEAYAAAGANVTGLTHADLDIRERDAVQRVLSAATPDVVVNTAAMHNVEACETDAVTAAAVNVTGAENLGVASRSAGFTLVHVSTDYVFDGNKGAPYVETDATGPLNVYGTTKLEGEHRVRAATDTHVIVRTSGLYGRMPCRAKPSGSFVKLMLKLGREKGEVRVVTDEMVTPTCTEPLARQIVALTNARQFGVFHVTAQGETSWFEFARAIFELAGVTVRMQPSSVADSPAKVRRPKYSVLDNAALRAAGIDIMPHWRESLTEHLRLA